MSKEISNLYPSPTGGLKNLLDPSLSDKYHYLSLLDLPLTYLINKSTLKNNYYQKVKRATDEKQVEQLNLAYKMLTDDFLRAKYVQGILEKNEKEPEIDFLFLSKCLEIEEEIKENENKTEKLKEIDKKLEEQIEECKLNYKEMKYLNKWSYLRRLKKIIKKVMPL
ncbi:hypothetical protein NUSPORA_01829 [Nucleospora cyclopteri]